MNTDWVNPDPSPWVNAPRDSDWECPFCKEAQKDRYVFGEHVKRHIAEDIL